MKIYIAGKVTGMEYEAKRLFEKTEKKILASGLFTEVVNPMKLPHEHDKHWQSYMKECLAALIGCDAILMQLGWDHSRGAILEHYMAGQLGIDRYYEVDPKENDEVWMEGEWMIELPTPKG